MNIRDYIGFIALFSQILFYLLVYLRIRGEKFSRTFLIQFFMVELIRIMTLGAASNALVILELFFIGKNHFKETGKDKQLFYALYTYNYCFIFTNFIDLFIEEFVSSTLFSEFYTTFWFISILFSYCIHEFLFRKLKLDTSHLNDEDEFVTEKIIRPLNKTLISSVVVLVGMQFFEIFFHREAVSHYTKSLIFAYIFLIISVLILLNNKLIAYKEEIMRREKEAQYERLNLYTRQVEQMYQTVRGFKHDYKNMLISLEESIRTGNIDEVRFLFHEILIRANVALSEGENIDDLSYLENPALKSLLYHKLMEATRDGVEVVIEIKQEIRDVKMDLLDFVRLLSVLLDNAIEAAKMASRPRLTLAIVQDEGRHIVYVSNSKAKGLVPIHCIYQKDYSTKGSDRGTGLFNVQEIVERFSHVMLETEQTEDTFTQMVYIGG